MESNILNSEDSLNLVKQYLEKELSYYRIIKSGFYTGYWWIDIKDKEENILIHFDGDIGYNFSINVHIDSKKFSLWQYDRKVNNATKTTEENILFQLNVLKRFLNEVGL